MRTHDYDLIFQGEGPEFAGKVLEQLVGQEYRRHDEVYSPHQVFVLVEGQWWRMFADGLMLYVQRWEKAPEAFAVPEDGMFWPLRDLTRELDLWGEILHGWSYGVRNALPSLTLNFESGLQITFFSSNDHAWSDFDVTRWSCSTMPQRMAGGLDDTLADKP
ncbi:hypothetical protein K7W42_14365 [Deinococcus sp. HMF7604]|uniref:hypothetical protein n=1 Tax=Deinococcus betulae TaxID=2873312 RepID=UPI001CCAEC4E|nr:hypothetical protein [Deinococcus betulae]MBZ9752041.1 hypothetical protein [Deinococcus betulae]